MIKHEKLLLLLLVIYSLICIVGVLHLRLLRLEIAAYRKALGRAASEPVEVNLRYIYPDD